MLLLFKAVKSFYGDADFFLWYLRSFFDKTVQQNRFVFGKSVKNSNILTAVDS